MLFGTHVHTKTYTRMFTAALFINAKNLETTILSWVNGYINLGTSDNGILFSAEKNEHSNHEKTCEVKVKVAQSCPTLCGPMDYTSSPWNSLGQNTGVDSLSLLQGIFPTQGSNPGLPHCRRILYQLRHTREARGRGYTQGKMTGND